MATRATTTFSRAPARPFPAAALAVTIFLVALNLRAALAALPPLVRTIQDDLGISGTVAGLLTTLPVLCMGVFAPVAQRLARRVGREATVAWALVLLLVGQLLRVFGGLLPLLMLSTLLVGAGIALAGTVLPGIVKEFFADRAGTVTGVYLLAMMVGAAAAAALAVPLADALGSWEASLASWSVLAVVGLIAWLPVVRRVNEHADPDVADEGTGPLPWRSRTSWLLASYLALQSFGFYAQIAWISPAYESHGWSARDAGLLLAFWSIAQLVTSVGAPALADRVLDRRPLVAVVVTGNLAGLAGIVLAPTAAPVLWVLLLAVGQGGFALGLVKLVDYAPTPAASARLSALVFLVSYSTASLGPLLFGALRDASGGFTAPFVLLLVVSAVQLTLVPWLRPGRLTEPAP